MHIEAETKWPPFSNSFSSIKKFDFDYNLTELCSEEYNKLSVIQVMAWRQTIHMPLSEPVMAHWKRIWHVAMTAITDSSFDDSHP